ncbi:O-antigen polymerase [Ignavibacterium album]|nr:O-antigen polymerase [Ignavibacterium album]
MNSLTVYSFVMGGLTFLYELKLLPYPELSFISWFYIISSSIAFFIGIISVIFAKKLFPSRAENLRIKVSDMPIFKDDGKVLKYSVIFFSLVGLFVALHRWYIMINIFGSIPSVFINAAWVYRINVKGEIKEFIPILPSFVYVGVFLSAIYTAYRGKFSFLSFFPIICIILKELTYFGRGEMLFSTLEFLFTFFLFRNLLNREDIKFKFSRKNAGFAILLLIILVITAASVVRTSRGIKENFRGATKELKQLEENLILTPSVYFYLSSDLGVLNQYLFKETEEANFGENTFRGVYYLLSKIKIVDEPPFFQKGYFIPFWSNTGTFIREIHADFGLLGVILVPFFLGVLLTYLWFRFFEEKNLIVLTVLVYLNLIIAFSFLVMVTRLNQWFLSQFLIILFLPVINKLASKKILN